MAHGVATKQLAARLIPNAFTVLYTCPSGHRTIVKDIHCVHGSALSTRLQVFLSTPAGVQLIIFDQVSAVTNFQLSTSGQFLVLEAGDTIQGRSQTNNNDWSIWASGAELTLP